jgi:hypothetical protein
VSLLIMGAITAAGSFFSLATVINVLLAVIIWVQAVAQIVALTVLRRCQPGLNRPYRQWLYALPAAGVVAYLGQARYHRAWPFGPKEVREAFLQAEQERPGPAAPTGAA